MDPGEILERARFAVSYGDHDAALRDYAWCFDHGLDAGRSFVGVRSSYVLNEWARLAAVFPPAETALRERRSRLAAELLSGGEERRSFRDVAAIDEVLGELESTYATFVELRQQCPEVAADVSGDALDAVRAAGDHALLLELIGELRTFFIHSFRSLETLLGLKSSIYRDMGAAGSRLGRARAASLREFAGELRAVYEAVEAVHGAEAAADARRLSIEVMDHRQIREELLPYLEAPEDA